MIHQFVLKKKVLFMQIVSDNLFLKKGLIYANCKWQFIFKQTKKKFFFMQVVSDKNYFFLKKVLFIKIVSDNLFFSKKSLVYANCK